jgi:3-dehydrosphinganine reductase
MQASSVVAARHTIVTGGSSGIGLALVRRLAGLGARTSVIALDDEDLVRLRQSQPSATCIGADVGDRDQAQAAVSACVDAQGPCDLLFACAGIIRPGYFMEATQPRQAPPARVRRG